MMPAGFGIRALRRQDAPELALAYDRNRAHLAPWDPARAPSFYTPTGQADLIDQQLVEVRARRLLALVMVKGRTIVGRVNLHSIVLGPFCSAVLGYWVDAEHQRRGLATAGVDEACQQAVLLGLHRLEASTLPSNVASQAVLAHSGFESFGFAPHYLHIAGRWQGCQLFQRILHDDPPVGVRS
ncbi:MAG TPA: GNAT family protein [Propionibacteriaceae bacterium]|jgi:ribosomal-protein-alanine N-acetyltransferase